MKETSLTLNIDNKIQIVPMVQFDLNDHQQIAFVGATLKKYDIKLGSAKGTSFKYLGSLYEQNEMFQRNIALKLLPGWWNFDRYPNPDVVIIENEAVESTINDVELNVGPVEQQETLLKPLNFADEEEVELAYDAPPPKEFVEQLMGIIKEKNIRLDSLVRFNKDMSVDFYNGMLAYSCLETAISSQFSADNVPLIKADLAIAIAFIINELKSKQ